MKFSIPFYINHFMLSLAVLKTSMILIRSPCCPAETSRPKLEEVKTNTRWNALIIVAVVVGLLAILISLLLHTGWIGS